MVIRTNIIKSETKEWAGLIYDEVDDKFKALFHFDFLVTCPKLAYDLKHELNGIITEHFRKICTEYDYYVGIGDMYCDAGDIEWVSKILGTMGYY